ncbi:hypothetical protein MNQ95_11655 [Pseudoxanthomonas daejeonensis]|uniref:hypothetical protein n=1 Tax=Pseudoxanthomonas daejeonensis TaxID=266062 RepID=UPI001390F9E2|nr:hypothetical protein [Pseudoxanthomonas daejeonensis]UNK56798.1 hypothetical protein MNQ95_11655 [Pseudoxanthomonas daejeonensis]
MLHPFAVFIALVLVAAWRLDPASLPRALAGMVFVVAVVWMFVWRRWRSGRWSTVDASNRQERPLLYGLALLLAAGYWWWLGGAASAMSTGVLAATAMICVAGLANRWIKLSLHMASLAFAGIAMLALWWPGGAVLLLLAPLLAWSRLRMGRHTGAEVAGGMALGVLAGATLLFL